jgi:3',5'-nucleoside bisphosphate phosphatase
MKDEKLPSFHPSSFILHPSMKGSPFTKVCQGLAVIRDRARADLHTHTTFSDGTYTPGELVHRAATAGLKAVAITDHDTLGGIEPARVAAGGRLEVIAGVEITAEFRGSELHLLGYFVRTDDPRLAAALTELRAARRERLIEMARRLSRLGASIEEDVAAIGDDVSVGRRHLAHILMARGYSHSRHHAFTKWLADPAVAEVSKQRIAVAEAIGLVRQAGGVTSWAHPPADADLGMLTELRDQGLQAVECVYPWPTGARGRRLRAMAEPLGLATTGGSDSHDPSPPTRAVGARTVSLDVVARIRAMSDQRSGGQGSRDTGQDP